MSLQRRRLLALVAVGTGTTTVAGCIDDLPGRSDDTDAGPDLELRCPDYERRGAERVVCSTDPPADSLVFEPDPERGELPRAEIDCTLENDREEPFETNFFNWSLHRYRDGEWYHLGPYAIPQPLHRLPPGERHVRRLVVDNTDLERVRPPEADGDGSEERHVAARHGLGPGAYAVAIEGASGDPETVYSAAFALEGDPVPLVAPETVVETERDGDAVEVVVDSTAPDHDLDRYDLTVRREPDPPRESHPLVDEQLYHPHYVGLRAAFAHLDTGVREVVVRGDDSQLTRRLTSGQGPDFVAHDGETFALRVDHHEG